MDRDDEALNAVIDGQATWAQKRRVRRRLRSSPEVAARFALDVRINDSLRAASRVERPTLRLERLTQAAVIGIAVLGGFGSGWFFRGAFRPEPPMADATAAFVSVFHQGRMTDLTPTQASWDLSALGFRPLGEAALETVEGDARLFAYQGAGGAKLIIYVRPASPNPDRAPGLRRQAGVETRYWFEMGRGYAIAGEASPADMAAVEAEVRRTSPA